MAVATNDAYSAASGQTMYVGRDAPPAGFAEAQILPNAVWTWFTDPRALYRDGITYIGWVNSSGTCGVSKHVHATRETTHFQLSSTGLEVDDHNNTALRFLPDGRLMCLYCKHGDYSGFRMRISTDANVTAFASEQVVSGTTPIAYSNPHLLSAAGKVFNHYRSGQGGVGTNPMNVRAYDPVAGTWDAERTWLSNTGYRPYIKSINNGVDRIDFLLTDAHPQQKATSVYHFYMRLVGGVEHFFKSDGTDLGTAAITPSDCTLIYDGTTTRAWVWDITYGQDGNPRVLFTRLFSNDHRYCYSRWTGSAWTSYVQIAPAGNYLYSQEPYYSAGICFDAVDPDRIYLSQNISGSSKGMQEWRTTDSGATWAKVREMTPDLSVRSCRPYSPKGHNGELSVLWWRDPYSTWTSFNTSIWGAG